MGFWDLVFVLQLGNNFESFSSGCPPFEMGMFDDLRKSVPNLKCVYACISEHVHVCTVPRTFQKKNSK